MIKTKSLDQLILKNDNVPLEVEILHLLKNLVITIDTSQLKELVEQKDHFFISTLNKIMFKRHSNNINAQYTQTYLTALDCMFRKLSAAENGDDFTLGNLQIEELDGANNTATNVLPEKYQTIFEGLDGPALLESIQ